METEISDIIRRILSDIRVELADEFDQNFEREAFFTQAWQRRKGPMRDTGRGLLTDSGRLRGSIASRISGSSVVFTSDLPYAGIHNDGGEIVVTERMKRWFWHKYYEASRGMGRRKDGKLRNDARNRRLGADAEFWKWMALKKAGTTIRIPRRRIVGMSPEVDKAVRDIITENLEAYFSDLAKDINPDQ